VLLDPVLPKECPSEKNFTKKMTSGGITDKKLRQQCFVNGKIWSFLFYRLKREVFKKVQIK
jgi:hypothetical protein